MPILSFKENSLIDALLRGLLASDLILQFTSLAGIEYVKVNNKIEAANILKRTSQRRLRSSLKGANTTRPETHKNAK